MSDDKRRAVRAWLYLDIDKVREQLMLIDDSYGTCANCKHLGLSYAKDRTCPGCGTTFKYAATKLKKPAEVAKIAQRIMNQDIPLQLIDRDDIERGSAKDAVSDLFK